MSAVFVSKDLNLSLSNAILIIAKVVMVNVQVDHIYGLERRDLKAATGYLSAE